MPNDPPPIFHFTDIRPWLREWMDWWRAQSRRNSHRHLSRLLGSSDPSLVLNAIEGRRPLSPQRAEAMLDTVLAELDPLEKRYFRALAEVDRARPEERAAAEERAARIRAEEEAQVLARERLEVLARWWYYAVACLAEGRHAVSFDDPAGIAAALYDRISPETAADAVRTLERVGLLVREEGRVRVEQPTFTTPAHVKSHVTRRYHADTIQLSESALAALSDVPLEEQRRSCFLGVTCSLSEEGLRAARDELFDFQQRLLAIAARDGEGPGPHRVVQLNLHLFPISKGVDGGEGEPR